MAAKRWRNARATILCGMDLPRLLVLRIWNGPERFRAVVRELEPARTRLFNDLGGLCAFLHDGGADEADVPSRSNPPAAAGADEE